MERLFLIGYMGVGKSTVGKALADTLNFDHIELDEWIEEEAGMAVKEIFEEWGEEVFRKMEKKELQKTLNKESVIISCGGGAPCYKDNLDLMKESGEVVYLKASPEFLADRLKDETSSRPLLPDIHEAPLLEKVREHLREREKCYEKANVTIEVENKRPTSIISEILKPHSK